VDEGPTVSGISRRSLGMSSDDVEQWDEKYSRAEPPPWEIGAAQPVVVELATSGQLRGRVLDAGCGTGENTIVAAQHGARVLGVDLSPRAIEQASGKARAKGVAVRFQVADALRLDRLDEVFDVVIDSGTFQGPAGSSTSLASVIGRRAIGGRVASAKPRSDRPLPGAGWSKSCESVCASGE
jgi:SAM-dependent methyltransferase